MFSSKSSDSKFSFKELMTSKRESYITNCKLGELDFEINMVRRDLNNCKEFSLDLLPNKEYREKINQEIFMCQHNMASLQMMRTNLVDEIKRTGMIFSNFCGFLKNKYENLEKIYIPKGMEFDSNGLRKVYTLDTGISIFEIIGPSSIDPANFFSEESTSDVVYEETAKVVLPETTAKVVSPLEKTAEVVSPPEKTAEESPSTNDVTPKTFRDIVSSNKGPQKITEKENQVKIDLKQLFKLDSSTKTRSVHPQSEELLKVNSEFKEYLGVVLNNFFENIVTSTYRRVRNIGPDLNKLFKDGEFERFSKSCCYYTTPDAKKFWKERCGLEPPLLSIKEDFSDLLKDYGYYLVTNSDKDGFKNTFLCPEESEILPKGAERLNGTM